MATSRLYHQNGSYFRTVPLFNGEMLFFSDDHLRFAVPALICFALVILPPIVILFCEPMLTMASNSQLIHRTNVQRLLRKTRLRMKPFLDSFQACFKNKYRFFAGMFFLYRIIVPVVSITSTSIIEAYIMSNLLLVAILLAHLLVQPFERKWHNQLDCAIFVNLIIINTLTMVNYYTSITTAPSSMILSVHVMILLQILLMALPLVYICTYISVNIYLTMKHRKSLHPAISTSSLRSKSNASEYDSLSFFPARMLEQDGLLSPETSNS